MKILTKLIVPLLVGTLVACGGKDDGPVTISPKTATVKVNEKVTFTATVKDADKPEILWSVEGGRANGTVTPQGVYTAPATAGTYKVIATNAKATDKKDTATVTVTPGDEEEEVTITISPTTATVVAGQSTTFTATVTGSTNTAVEWTVDNGTGSGLITDEGEFFGATPGTVTVTATSVADPTKSASATVTVTAAPTVAIVLTPTEATVDQGGTVALTAVVVGNDNTDVTWAVTGGNANGTIDSAGTYTAPNKAGTFDVTVTSVADPTVSQTAHITVREVAITIDPTSATLTQGDTQFFTATVTGTVNTSATFTVQGGDANGTIDIAGKYTAPNKSGTFTVIATSAADSTKTASATVTVGGITVSVSPASVTLDQGATADFTATVTGHSNTAVTWSLLEANAGSVDASGHYTAPTGHGGTYTLVATSVVDSTAKGTATITVNGLSVVIAPKTATLDQGGTQAFTATVTGTSNTAVTWAVTGGAANGTITSAGVYTAPNKAGTYTVTVTSAANSEATDSATITVRDVAVTIDPATASLEQGATQAFTASVTGTGNTAVTWSVAGTGNGSITSAGVYTAPNKAGTFTVTATSVADATKSASATVTVGGITVSVTPATASVDQGGTQTFTASVTGHSNTGVTWSVEGTGNGSITSAGVYTAPNKAGTFTVTATSVVDSTAKGSATITVNAITVTIAPKTVTLGQGLSQTFTATVTGTSNTAVTWAVTGGDTNGTITSAGVYTAPDHTGTFTVTATSAADGSVSDSATVTVPVAAGLAYTDPTGNGWKLVKNAQASTATRLVLDLVGPSGDSGRGVDLTLSTNTTLAGFAKVADADAEYVANHAFALGAAPQFLKGIVKNGNLVAGVFQKGTSSPATDYTAPLISVALELNAGTTVPSNTAVSLAVVKAHALPATGTLAGIDVAVGSVIAQ